MRVTLQPSLACPSSAALADPRSYGDAVAMQRTFEITTTGPGLYEFTRDVARWVDGDGLLTLFIQHTSASLTINENADPDVRRCVGAEAMQ